MEQVWRAPHWEVQIIEVNYVFCMLHIHTVHIIIHGCAHRIAYVQQNDNGLKNSFFSL